MLGGRRAMICSSGWCIVGFVGRWGAGSFLWLLPAVARLGASENTRRPVGVSYVGAFADRDQRATVLSAEAQMHAPGAMGAGPPIGRCADRAGIAEVFVVGHRAVLRAGDPAAHAAGGVEGGWGSGTEGRRL